MYGGFVVPPDDDGADFGVLFWHKDGFSTACGHGTIALGVWAVDSGRVVAPEDGTVDVTIDVPSGRVTARVHRNAGRTDRVDFVNVASHLIADGLRVPTSRGDVSVTLAFGGAIYACVRAADVGLTVIPERLPELIEVGREIKWALNDSPEAQHLEDPRLSGVYGTILFDELEPGPGGELQQRNVTIFADGEVDRSPCGSGTAARVAVLAAAGRLGESQVLRHRSIVGSEFVARVLSSAPRGAGISVIPQVSGMAYKTAEHVFFLDSYDPLIPGFVLR